MGRRPAVGSLGYKMLKEFEMNGFVANSSGRKNQFLALLRSNYGEYYRIFKATHRGKKRKEYLRFGTYEIFGKKIFYYYDIRRKEEFVEFLVKLFYEKNPKPDIGAKSVFTRILKYHGLSWTERKKEIDDR